VPLLQFGGWVKFAVLLARTIRSEAAGSRWGKHAMRPQRRLCLRVRMGRPGDPEVVRCSSVPEMRTNRPEPAIAGGLVFGRQHDCDHALGDGRVRRVRRVMAEGVIKIVDLEQDVVAINIE
jgi:hypothetical protein